MDGPAPLCTGNGGSRGEWRDWGNGHRVRRVSVGGRVVGDTGVGGEGGPEGVGSVSYEEGVEGFSAPVESSS